MALSASQLEAQLSQAKTHLSRLHQHQQDGHQVDSPTASTSSSSAIHLLQRAKLATDQIECIELNRSLLPLLQSISANTDSATSSCTALGLLLLTHPQNELEGRKSSAQLQAVREWHSSLHEAARQSGLLIFRKFMSKISYDEEGCNILHRVFTADLTDAEEKEEVDQKMDASQIREWNAVCRCLIELQILHDALLASNLQSRQLEQQQAEECQQQSGVTQQPTLLPTNWRYNIVDELCRPIANRLRYHFLDETSILNTTNNDSSGGEGSMERLADWLFRYLREVVDGGVFSLMDDLEGLIHRVMEGILLRLPEDFAEETLLRENEQNSSVLSRQTIYQLHEQYHFNPTPYFLREIVRMARHALRSKSFFSHPDVVGRDCRPAVARRGIEQLFLFDAFVMEKLAENCDAPDESGCLIMPPRLADIFLSSNEGLLRWWLDEERYGAISIMKNCASSTLSSFQLLQKADSDVPTDTSVKKDSASASSKQQPPLFPPISELFVSLIHSSHIKSNAFSDIHAQQLYLTNVIVPLSFEYLDTVHAEASLLRKRLVARSKSGSNIPSDNDLTTNVLEWIGIINGTNIAAAIVNTCIEKGGKKELLERVAISFERMRDAMVEDFVSAFVETIVNERAKFASYQMRCPFLLSQPHVEPEHRHGQREAPPSLHLSTDLNDSYHVLSVAVQACRASLAMVTNLTASQAGSSNSSANLGSNNAALLSYGACILKEALSHSISQKLLDIAIDPQGMTPEIHLAGAQQFRHDSMTIISLFTSKSASNDGTGPLDRVATASRLMSLSTSQLDQLKETLFELSSSTNRIGSLFAGNNMMDGEDGGRTRTRLDVESFYSDERLMVEAESMLSAKGFPALALEESLSIINRRM